MPDGERRLKDEVYRKAAEPAVEFLLALLRTPDRRLLRTYRNGQAKIPAYLEDYARHFGEDPEDGGAIADVGLDAPVEGHAQDVQCYGRPTP